MVLIVWTIFWVSCGKDESDEIPTKWEGRETDFQKDFTTQKEGNETLILHRKSTEPFEGKLKGMEPHIAPYKILKKEG